MIISNYSGFRAFAGEWEDWCDQKFPNDPVNLAKCKGWAPFAPWTDVGAAMRGIPKPGSIIAPFLPPTTGGAQTDPDPSGGIGSAPTGLLITGAIVLAIGVLAVVSSKKRG